MDPAILHHSAGKMGGFAALGLGLAALGVFVARLPPDPDYHGRSAWLVDLVGPDGMWWLMVALAVAGLAVAVASLRLLLSGDRIAGVADNDGIMLRSLWGTKRFRWDEIGDVRLRSVAAGAKTQHMLQIDGIGRRKAVLTSGTISGGVNAIEAWIEDAAAVHRSLGASAR